MPKGENSSNLNVQNPHSTAELPGFLPGPGLLPGPSFGVNAGAGTIRIGFWAPLYYNYTTKNPQNSIGNYSGPYITVSLINQSTKSLGLAA